MDVPKFFYLKRGDTLPIFETVLLNPDGSIHDLTGVSSAKMHVTNAATGQAFSLTLEIVAPPTSGKVRHSWQAAMWTGGSALGVGLHRIEYEVRGSGDARLTFPNATSDVLSVYADIADAP